jgi:hypothetical protein
MFGVLGAFRSDLRALDHTPPVIEFFAGEVSPLCGSHLLHRGVWLPNLNQVVKVVNHANALRNSATDAGAGCRSVMRPAFATWPGTSWPTICGKRRAAARRRSMSMPVS